VRVAAGPGREILELSCARSMLPLCSGLTHRWCMGLPAGHAVTQFPPLPASKCKGGAGGLRPCSRPGLTCHARHDGAFRFSTLRNRLAGDSGASLRTQPAWSGNASKGVRRVLCRKFVCGGKLLVGLRPQSPARRTAGGDCFGQLPIAGSIPVAGCRATAYQHTKGFSAA
jgi:hypothetical protein